MSYYSGKTPISKDPLEKLSRVNVLVLDGGAKAATLIKAIFAALGLNNVFIATDGYQGVQIMKEIRIHMIFTDWELKVNRASNANTPDLAEVTPDYAPISGVKFVERIRKSSLSPNPFITDQSYKGPCRRRKQADMPPGFKNRRIREVRLIRSMTS